MTGKGEDSKDLHRREAFLHEDIYFFLFYYYDWEIDDDFFTCFPSTVLDRARRLPFFFPFSFFLFLFLFFWEGDFYYYDYDHYYYCYGYGFIPI